MKTKKTIRLASFLVLLAMLLTAFASFAVSAASTSKTVPTSGKAVYVTVQTGSGLFYALGWKKTSVTFRNTGNKAIYVGAMYLYPGASYSKSVYGSGKRLTYTISNGAGQSRGDGRVSVTTSAGSVW